MTKPMSPPGGAPEIMTNPFAAADVDDRARAFWRAQGATLEHMRSFLDGWYARRRNAAASTADCCAHLMSEGGDLSAAARAWAEWTSGAMERLRDDLSAQTTLATQIAAEMTDALSANGGTHHRPRKSHAEPSENDGTRVRPAADIR